VQDGCREADGGAGILRLAFQHKVAVLDFGQLAADSRTVGISGDNEDPVARQGLKPVIGGTQKRAPRAGEVVKEFGSCCT
jgi:hypothetical protein